MVWKKKKTYTLTNTQLIASVYHFADYQIGDMVLKKESVERNIIHYPLYGMDGLNGRMSMIIFMSETERLCTTFYGIE